MMILAGLYSFCSNTQSLKMPLASRSNRTFMADVPNDSMSDAGDLAQAGILKNKKARR